MGVQRAKGGLGAAVQLVGAAAEVNARCILYTAILHNLLGDVPYMVNDIARCLRCLSTTSVTCTAAVHVLCTTSVTCSKLCRYCVPPVQCALQLCMYFAPHV